MAITVRCWNITAPEAPLEQGLLEELSEAAAPHYTPMHLGRIYCTVAKHFRAHSNNTIIRSLYSILHKRLWTSKHPLTLPVPSETSRQVSSQVRTCTFLTPASTGTEVLHQGFQGELSLLALAGLLSETIRLVSAHQEHQAGQARRRAGSTSGHVSLLAWERSGKRA